MTEDYRSPPESDSDWRDALTQRVTRAEKRLTALEATPAPAPPPPVRRVTVDELEGILYRGGAESLLACARLAAVLLNHPRIGPLLRGEGAPAKRVELPEKPPPGLLPLCDMLERKGESLVRQTWAAARDEVARQQEVG